MTNEEINRLRGMMAEHGPVVFLKTAATCAEDLSDVSAEDGDPVASRWWDETSEGLTSLSSKVSQ